MDKTIKNKNIKNIKWGSNTPLDVDVYVEGSGSVNVKSKKELINVHQKNLKLLEAKLAKEEKKIKELKAKEFTICPITGAKKKIDIYDNTPYTKNDIEESKKILNNVDKFITQKYNDYHQELQEAKNDIKLIDSYLYDEGKKLCDLNSWYFKFNKIIDDRIKEGEVIDFNGYKIKEAYCYKIKTSFGDEGELIWTITIANLATNEFTKRKYYTLRVEDKINGGDKIIFCEGSLEGTTKIVDISTLKKIAKKKVIRDLEKSIVKRIQRKTHMLNSIKEYKKLICDMEVHMNK